MSAEHHDHGNGTQDVKNSETLFGNGFRASVRHKARL
jgi:hypothetical protein